ncbi:YozQ family protein [Paenibacillus gansuensis]|uniref:YozQ family protein n=1 Tax=Paenibacillus gansuensis TaxID=306542 RepID=A0ABW5P9B4_9BACL
MAGNNREESLPNRDLLKAADEVAEHRYNVTDYEGEGQLSQGTATTHEQYSDAYKAGTSDGVVMLENGETCKLYDDETATNNDTGTAND